jgi:hypothetical protein
MMRVFLVLALVFVLAGGGHATAGQLAEFNARIEQINQPYKSALFYLRTGNAGVASLELAQAVQNWKALTGQYGDAPPDPFGDDPGWTATADAISAAFEKGARLASEGDSKAADAALSPVRDHLHQLRQRNGVRLRADCIYDLNAQMEVLFRYRHDPPDLAKLPERNAAKSASAVYAHILEGCRAMASKELREDENFNSIFGSATASAARLFEPIDAGDQTGFVNLLRELKSFDVIIFLRWG